MTLTVVDAEVGSAPGAGVRVAGDRIVAVGADVRPEPGDEVVDARGGAVIPGLHDHHVHLRALAAARVSVDVSPAAVHDAAGFAAALVTATSRGGWVRAIGYHESIAGDLDAAALDAIVGDALVRVQHRSGALWVLSSAAVRAAGIDAPDGRLWRRDAMLRDRLAPLDLDLAAVGRAAAELGITGFTDADPTRAASDLDELLALPQRVVAMGPVGLRSPHDAIAVGPVKVILDDDDLPELSALAALIDAAHGESRGIAVHCVTRAQAVLTVVALQEAGSNGLDRIEHGGLLPVDLLDDIARLGVTVVTQPSFIVERGDSYRRDVEPGDVVDLYRAGSLRRAGIALAAGSDAPYASLDPWAAMRAAVSRATAAGVVLGAEERISAGEALGLFTGRPEQPGAPRRVAVGEPADLVVLRTPLAEALADPSASLVAATIIRGEAVFTRP